MDFELDTNDVNTAFLRAKLEEEVYITIPDGYKPKSKATKYLRLFKAMYDWNKSRETIATIKRLIDSNFKIKDKGPIKFFLDIHFTRNRKGRTIQIHQWSKIERLI